MVKMGKNILKVLFEDELARHRFVGLEYDRLIFLLNESIIIGKTHFNLDDNYDLDINELNNLLSEFINNNQIVKYENTYYLESNESKKYSDKTQKSEWNSSDAWILLTIFNMKPMTKFRIENLAILSTIIGKSILTPKKMYEGLNKLISSKMIKYNNIKKEFIICNKSKLFKSKLEKYLKIDEFKRNDGYEITRNLLMCPCCGVKLDKVYWLNIYTEQELKDILGANVCQYSLR